MPTDRVLLTIAKLSFEGMRFDDDLTIRGDIPECVLWAELADLDPEELSTALERLRLEGAVRAILAPIPPAVFKRQRYKSIDGREWSLKVNIDGILTVQSERHVGVWATSAHTQYRLTPAGARRVRADREPATKTDKVIWMSPAELAAAFNVEHEALRKRLKRLRSQNHGCYREVADRGPREAWYLYDVAAVKPIIDSLKSLQTRRTKTSGERPAKKNHGPKSL